MDIPRGGSAAAPKTRILVITVSYKTAPLVIKSLKALARERTRHPEFEIQSFIVDNASGDAPAIRDAIASEGYGDWVTVHEAEHNGGFSFGSNLGFRHAYESSSPPDYLFLLSPDAEVRPLAIEQLVKFLQTAPKAAVAGSQLLNEDESPWPYAFRFPSIWSEIDEGLASGAVSKLLSQWVVNRKMGDGLEQVDWLPATAMMIRRTALDQVGGLDEAYFLYYEDLDFFFKLRQHGWETWYVPSSRVMHAVGAGATPRPKAELPDYWFESRRRYFAKNFGLRYAMATDIAALAAHVLGHVKDRVRGQSAPNHLEYVSNFLRNSVLHKKNRRLAPNIEFRPPSSLYGKR